MVRKEWKPLPHLLSGGVSRCDKNPGLGLRADIYPIRTRSRLNEKENVRRRSLQQLLRNSSGIHYYARTFSLT